MRFMPFVYFEIPNTHEGKFNNYQLTDEPILKLLTYWYQPRINLKKMSKYGRIVGFINKTAGSDSIYLEVEYKECTEQQLKDVILRQNQPINYYLCPDFSQVPLDMFNLQNQPEMR